MDLEKTPRISSPDAPIACESCSEIASRWFDFAWAQAVLGPDGYDRVRVRRDVKEWIRRQHGWDNMRGRGGRDRKLKNSVDHYGPRSTGGRPRLRLGRPKLARLCAYAEPWVEHLHEIISPMLKAGLHEAEFPGEHLERSRVPEWMVLASEVIEDDLAVSEGLWKIRRLAVARRVVAYLIGLPEHKAETHGDESFDTLLRRSGDAIRDQLRDANRLEKGIEEERDRAETVWNFLWSRATPEGRETLLKFASGTDHRS